MAPTLLEIAEAPSRELIAARWRTAVERGLPALVTAANSQSRPILERLGFDRLGEIAILADTL